MVKTVAKPKMSIAIAGAGLSGAVVARCLADSGGFKVSVFDKRKHIAGNCHTFRDSKTGIMIHQYGPHIFNTSREDVWKYVNRFSEFKECHHRVKAITTRGEFSIPINLSTINQFFGIKLDSQQAVEFLESKVDRSITNPRNFEEIALMIIGKELYDNFYYGYTKKQWGVLPRELPASIFKRIPLRLNQNDLYFDQTYQGIPVEGYSKMIAEILAHEDIQVMLETELRPQHIFEYDHVFWSGQLDDFFNFQLGALNYRTLFFEKGECQGDFQKTATVNYCDEKVPFTRITEPKHFTPWETFETSVYFKEFSSEWKHGDIPYYPVRLESDLNLLKKYVELAELQDQVSFVGRLGTYQYLDMHVVIKDALDLSAQCLAEPKLRRWPKFSRSPI